MISVELLHNPPLFLTVAALGFRVLLPVFVAVGALLWLSRQNALQGKQIVRLTWSLCAWVALAIGFCMSGWYSPAFIPVAVFVPLFAMFVAIARQGQSQWLAVLPLRLLVGLQVFRLLGGMFVYLWYRGWVPGYFALPVGIGDLLVGAGAVYFLWRYSKGQPVSEKYLLAWCLLGIADHLLALGLGRILTAEQLYVFTELHADKSPILYPLNLLPIFVVPFSVILHVLTIVRLRH